jgi:hypothetical protein
MLREWICKDKDPTFSANLAQTGTLIESENPLVHQRSDALKALADGTASQADLARRCNLC